MMALTIGIRVMHLWSLTLLMGVFGFLLLVARPAYEEGGRGDWPARREGAPEGPPAEDRHDGPAGDEPEADPRDRGPPPPGPTPEPGPERHAQGGHDPHIAGHHPGEGVVLGIVPEEAEERGEEPRGDQREQRAGHELGDERALPGEPAHAHQAGEEERGPQGREPIPCSGPHATQTPARSAWARRS